MGFIDSDKQDPSESGNDDRFLPLFFPTLPSFLNGMANRIEGMGQGRMLDRRCGPRSDRPPASRYRVTLDRERRASSERGSILAPHRNEGDSSTHLSGFFRLENAENKSFSVCSLYLLVSPFPSLPMSKWYNQAEEMTRF